MSYYRRRLSPIKPGEPIDYKDVDLLRKFVTERGKILPRRITGLTSQQQRDLTGSINRALFLALFPFIKAYVYTWGPGIAGPLRATPWLSDELWLWLCSELKTLALDIKFHQI